MECKPIRICGWFRFKFDELRNKIITSGIYNSLLLAPMPTCVTSQIMGFNECFEPYIIYIY